MNVIVMFSGGGALGAFDCGVWNVLAPVLRDRGARLIGAGGVSIGAINAACLARHGSDLRAGAAALEALWCEQLVTPSFPFAGWFGDREQHRWNGLLTGLLLGNRQLYRSHSPHWNPLAGLNRREQPLMDRSGMWQWIATHIGAVSAASEQDPLLCVAAVDVVGGELVLFDSARAPVTVEHLAASSALPMLFEPVAIDGRLYWDGDITRESMLPGMLDRLRRSGRLATDTGEQTLLISIDHMPRTASRMPRSDVELVHRALELLLQGKTVVGADELDGVTHVIEIAREPMEHDAVSGQFDFSPERIRELVEQGQRQAERAWTGRWTEVVGRGEIGRAAPDRQRPPSPAASPLH
jgi:NTE family protein